MMQQIGSRNNPQNCLISGRTIGNFTHVGKGCGRIAIGWRDTNNGATMENGTGSEDLLRLRVDRILKGL